MAEDQDRAVEFRLPAECLRRFMALEKQLADYLKAHTEIQRYQPYVLRILETLEGVHDRLGEVREMTVNLNARMVALENAAEETRNMIKRNGGKE